jgi:O-methyltransferase domain/Dimerisation domain
MEDRVKMTDVIMGFVPAQAVAVATELGIADLLAREPMTAEQLAASTNSHPRTLFRLLRYLASLGIFHADEHNRFNLTPMASLLRSDVKDSMRSMARIMGRSGPPSSNHLIDAVRSAKNPFEEAFGKSLFAFLSEHPEEAGLFDAAMNGFHGGETGAMLEAYSFAEIDALADIGCGNGSLLTATLKRYPKLRGLFFDQPHVIERARAGIEASGLADRYQLQSGSFFEAVPGGADAYLLRHIIHDWNDEDSLRVLRNVRAVIPQTGRLLLVEMVIPEGNDPSIAKNFDMVMMLFPPNGLERTEDEYRKLLKSAGFELSRITPTASPVSVIEGRPS